MRTALAVLLLAAAPAHSADLDHSAWDRLLQRYVNAQHLVDYQGWKSTGAAELGTYLAMLAEPWPAGLSSDARKAALINAYNALTIRWILTNYPIASIWRTHHPFTEARHRLGGRAVSLDAIESELRAMGDPRIHAALVCAARSCPPLRREAYRSERIEEQFNDNVREWLAMPDRNEFQPDNNRAAVSMIFKWYKEDFDKYAGSVPAFLAKYSPQAQFLLSPKAKIDYKRYHWGLNDASGLGMDYSQAKFTWDYLRNK